MNEIGPPTIREYLSRGGKWVPWYDFFLPPMERRGIPFVHYIPVYKSVLVKEQKKEITKKVMIDGQKHELTLKLRYDDECSNGHNTFSITMDGYRIAGNNRRVFEFGGMCHEQVKRHFNEYSHLIKWHLCSSDGPLHYIANTVYFAKRRELENAKESAIFSDREDVTLEELQDEEFLKARLPKLMFTFKLEMESLGFTF